MIKNLSTDKKSTIYISLMLLITSPIIIFSWFDSFLFMWIFFFHIAAVGAINKKGTHTIVLSTALYIISYLPFWVILHITSYPIEVEGFIILLGIILFLTAQAIYPILNKYFQKWFIAASNEKNNYSHIENYPAVMCGMHYSRTSHKFEYGYNNLRCRHDNECFAKMKMLNVERIIGVLGNDDMSGYINGNYYIIIVNDEKQEFINADYDIIEIHENVKIKDYDSIINKIVSFFYNEIQRFKPITEVIVRVVGKPDISENTKRLIMQKFLKVEYFEK